MPRVEIDYSFVKFESDDKQKPVLMLWYVQKQYGAAVLMQGKGRDDARSAGVVNKFLHVNHAKRVNFDFC